jgi:hypothetical protein
MAPIVHGLEAKYNDQVRFTYLDIDNPANDRFKQALDYRYQPHIFLLDGEGNIQNQWVGAVPEETLEAAIQEGLTE